MMIEKKIWLDMDGNFVGLYDVENWLDDLIHFSPRPYEVAKPLVNMSVFARQLNRLSKLGYEINIVSWLSKNSTPDYDKAVTKAKKNWLKKHLPSVKFNRIEILSYGIPKSSVGSGYLFDDEENNRREWNGIAFSNTELLSELKRLA